VQRPTDSTHITTLASATMIHASEELYSSFIMSSIKRSSWILFLAIFSLPRVTFAATIVSSFGPGHGYDVNGGLSISTIGSANADEVATAVSFTPSATFTLTQIDLALGYVSGTNAFLVELVHDNGGPTGSLIESWTFAAPDFGGPDLDALTPAGSVPLNSGTPYWVVVLPGGSDTWGGWNHPSPDTFVGGQTVSRDRGVTWFPPVVAGGVPAFDVLGTQTPEPVPVLLTGMGLVALGFARRRYPK
jgi:hypothetical protein